MLLIALGVVILAFSVFWIRKPYFTNIQLVVYSLKATCCTVVGLVVVVVGILAPFHGYHEPILMQECELVELVEDTGVYIIEDSNRTPYYKYAADSYETGIHDPYTDSNIEIVISDKYEKPILAKYYAKAKKGVFGLGIFMNETEYKIYAREENIRRLK